MTYELTEGGVTRLTDGASIPNAEGNRDWREFQEWLAEGNEARPVKPSDSYDWDEFGIEWVLNDTRQAVVDREEFKVSRADIISSAVVTTSFGNTFDADEPSQQRMGRAILVAGETAQTETPWVLADNTVIQVTRPELVEALALSLQAQSDAWFPTP
jgi:hypothetical protein